MSVGYEVSKVVGQNQLDLWPKSIHSSEILYLVNRLDMILKYEVLKDLKLSKNGNKKKTFLCITIIHIFK